MSVSLCLCVSVSVCAALDYLNDELVPDDKRGFKHELWQVCVMCVCVHLYLSERERERESER